MIHCSDSIDLIELPPPEHPTALNEGSIDAYIVGEPFAAKAEVDGFVERFQADFAVIDSTYIFLTVPLLASLARCRPRLMARIASRSTAIIAGVYSWPRYLPRPLRR